MIKKVILVLAVIFSGILIYTVLPQSGIQDNKLYTVDYQEPSKDIKKIDSDIRSKSNDKFYDITNLSNKLNSNDILIAVTKDKNVFFYMAPTTAEVPKKPFILKGRTSMDMDLYMKDLSTGNITCITKAIPFITHSSFNPDGTMAVFKGEGLMLLYSLEENRLLLTDELAKEQIDAASWSVDGKKLYLQYSFIPNGGVIYMDSLKLSQAYEIKEEVFFKNKLDEDRYFGVTQNLNSSSALLSTCSTVVVDSKGNELKTLSSGIYKDHFENSILVKNLNNTYSYINDISSVAPAQELTDKVVYDSGFVYDGGLYYITESENTSKNTFTLHRLDSKGKEVTHCEIYGSSLLLQPNGKKAYINGPNLEVFDFETNGLKVKPNAPEPQDTDLNPVLRSALADTKVRLLKIEHLRNSPYFTASGASSADKLISKAFNSVPKALSELYLSLNPQERIVLNSFNQLDNNNAEAEVHITLGTYWLGEFNGTYKLKLMKDGQQWKISEVVTN